MIRERLFRVSPDAGLAGVVMASWVLDCPGCKATFVHSRVATDFDQRMMDHYYPLTPKPDFPPEGLLVECPNCRLSSVFKRHQLLYRAY
jgi:hypothetical protein